MKTKTPSTLPLESAERAIAKTFVGYGLAITSFLLMVIVLA